MYRYGAIASLVIGVRGESRVYRVKGSIAIATAPIYG